MTINTPLVSIITPVYNAERFLQDTIKSVQNQTYGNWELLFIDDQSSDDSVSLIKEARQADKRIKLIQMPQNGGVAKARNAGTQAAKGRYIAFLDADDLWEKEKLQKQVDFALKNNASFVYSSYRFADENGKPTAAPVAVPSKINYSQALRNHIIWTSTVLLDTEQISKDLMMMPDVRRGQDAATWWQILRETGASAHGIVEPLALYRRTNDSLSANKLKAVKRTWYLFRDVEKLNLLESCYSFCFYGYNALKKRV